MGATAVTLAGQTAIITGGSSGIGLAVAAELHARGANVLLVGRNSERLDAAVARLRSRAVPNVAGLALDVTCRDDMQRMAEMAGERYGRIDILVAAAGILRPGSGRIATVRDTPTADWEEILAVNLRGMFLSNQAVLPPMMRQRSGQILNVSSTSGRHGHAFDAAYCASKFAVLGLSEALAEEMRPYGIRVQAVLPGATESMIWEQNRLPRPVRVLPVERLVRAMVLMLELPLDAILPAMSVAPEAEGVRPAWLRSTATAG